MTYHSIVYYIIVYYIIPPPAQGRQSIDNSKSLEIQRLRSYMFNTCNTTCIKQQI